jgi:S1-C subfamily serine protease
VDVVDLLLIVVVVMAAIHGLRLGALVQVLTFGGFLLGILLGALLATVIASSLKSGPLRAGITLALVLGLAVMLGVTGRVLGTWSNAALRRHHLGRADSVLGVAVAVLAVLFSAWLVANVVGTSTRSAWWDSQIQRSDVLRGIDAVMPPVPTVFAHVQAFLDNSGFPPVFVGLTPPTAMPVPQPSGSKTKALAAAAAPSTVKVLGNACGYVQEGSGFVVGPGLVVTNAHVVAGEPSTQVEVAGTSYPATTVLFDPKFDLAVLRTRAPLGPALALDQSDVSRGTQGAVLGYPEDGGLSVGPGAVAAELSAEGRDIYNEGLVVRSVYELDAVIEPGNSGGPIVGSDGMVIGMVFSRSTVNPDVGYALASPGVLSRVRTAAFRTSAVSTGSCTS